MTEPINREPVDDWHSDLDHFDPEFVADPYPIYEELRGQCPVAHSDRYGGMTWLTKASDVAAAANATLDSILAERIPLYEECADLTVDADQSIQTVLTNLLRALSIHTGSA